VSKAVQAAISKVVAAAKVGAKENKEEANNKKAGLKTSLQAVEKVSTAYFMLILFKTTPR
jgi:hypothetical protein